MLLTMAKPGDENKVKKVSGRPDIRQHLENLGFVAGSSVTIVTQMGGNIIVNVKQSRIAISREMANRIIV